MYVSVVASFYSSKEVKKGEGKDTRSDDSWKTFEKKKKNFNP